MEETMERNKQHKQWQQKPYTIVHFTKEHKSNSQMDQLMKRFTFMGCEIRQKIRRNQKKNLRIQQYLWTYQQQNIIYNNIETAMQTKIVVECSVQHSLSFILIFNFTIEIHLALK
jgi:hypothetical protein